MRMLRQRVESPMFVDARCLRCDVKDGDIALAPLAKRKRYRGGSVASASSCLGTARRWLMASEMLSYPEPSNIEHPISDFTAVLSEPSSVST